MSKANDTLDDRCLGYIVKKFEQVRKKGGWGVWPGDPHMYREVIKRIE